MRIAKKIAISLFITILFCSLFYFFALSGLFDYIETSLFHPRVQQRYQELVEDATQQLEQFYTSNRSRFMAVSSAPAISDLFSFERSQETIEMVEVLFGQLRSQIPALAFTRIFDVSAQRLWFSTYATDIIRDTSVSRQYVSVSALDSEYHAPRDLARRIESQDLLFDPNANQFIFRYSVKDNFDIPVGLAVYHVGINDLMAQFVQDGIIGLGEQFIILENDAVLINFSPRFDRSIRDAIESNWQSILQNQDGFSLLSDSTDAGYVIFSGQVSGPGSIVIIAPESEFVLSETTRLAFMALIAFSLFLVVFLILNLRQDRMVIIASRIKRFQLDLLRGYVEGRESIDLQQWRSDLEERRSELTAEIKRDLGNLKRNEDEEINELIRKNWDNIIETLTDSASRTVTNTGIDSTVDLSRLEALLARMAERIPAPDSTADKPATPDATQPPITAPRPAPAQPYPAPVEVADTELPSQVVERSDMEEVAELPPGESQSSAEVTAPTGRVQETGSLDSILLEVWDNLDGIPELSDDSTEYPSALQDRPVEATNMRAASDRAEPLTDVATPGVEEPEAIAGEPVTEDRSEFGETVSIRPESEVVESHPVEDVSTKRGEIGAMQRQGLFARLMIFRGAAEEQGLEPIGSGEEQQNHGTGINPAAGTGTVGAEIDERDPVFADTASDAEDIEDLSSAEELRSSADKGSEEDVRDPEMVSLARSLLDQ